MPNEDDQMIDAEDEVVELCDAPPAGALVPVTGPSKALALGGGMAMLDIAELQRALDGHQDRRVAFRTWLFSQMKRGTHYALPPGVVEQDVDPARWKNRPMLYEAGAEFILDHSNAYHRFEAAKDIWEQLGSQPGVICIRCLLLDKNTGVVAGEGLGAATIAAESKGRSASGGGGPEHKAVAKASKRAFVSAVRLTFRISDVCADEGWEAQPQEKPIPAKPVAPASPPPAREPADKSADRSMRDKLGKLFHEWVKQHADGESIGAKPAFVAWAKDVTHSSADLSVLENWTPGCVEACRVELFGSIM